MSTVIGPVPPRQLERQPLGTPEPGQSTYPRAAPPRAREWGIHPPAPAGPEGDSWGVCPPGTSSQQGGLWLWQKPLGKETQPLEVGQCPLMGGRREVGKSPVSLSLALPPWRTQAQGGRDVAASQQEAGRTGTRLPDLPELTLQEAPPQGDGCHHSLGGTGHAGHQPASEGNSEGTLSWLHRNK